MATTLPYWSQVEKKGYIGARTQWVEFGDGIRGFLGIPERGRAPYPAMVLGHERYGLVLDSLDQVAKLAAYGYVALAPDMASKYKGDIAAINRGEAAGGWDADTVKEYLAASYDYLAAMPEVDGERISCMGFCASGGWAWVLNSVRPGLAACICYYGGGSYNEELMAKVTAPTLFAYGENDHTTPIERTFAFRDEMERHNKTCEISLVPDMPHGWLNDTMIGRYRQKEAGDAWKQIMDFLDRVHAGYYKSDRVQIKFEADFAVNYDFSKSVRFAEGPFPEPDMRPERFGGVLEDMKRAVAEGRAPKSELDELVGLYPEYFASHPELLA
jgi:carboxymethylenebutenolidase